MCWNTTVREEREERKSEKCRRKDQGAVAQCHAAGGEGCENSEKPVLTGASGFERGHGVEIDRAILTLAHLNLTGSAGHLPARDSVVDKGGALRPDILGAVLDFPARDKLEQAFDAGNADALVVDQLPDALDPFNIIIGKKPFVALSRRFQQTLFFVDPDGTRMHIE